MGGLSARLFVCGLLVLLFLGAPSLAAFLMMAGLVAMIVGLLGGFLKWLLVFPNDNQES